MPILSVTDLAHAHGDAELFRDVAFAIEPKEKVALIGRNGSGKTTLLRLLAGLDDPLHGRVARECWARPAYLAQVPARGTDGDVLTRVLTGAADVQAMEARLRELEHLMARPDVHEDPDRLAEVMSEYGGVHDHFEHVGGFGLHTAARSVLTGLGFREADFTRSVDELSGGWRVRAELARALLTEPDILLLDEPTNHLDLVATEWLEEYLQSFPGAILIVSHDRTLLDAVTARTLELEDGSLTSYPGSYSAYAVVKAERVRRQSELFERRQEEIAKLEDYIRRYKAGNRATQAKSREKMLARVQARPAHRTRRHAVNPSAASGSRQDAMRVHVDTQRTSGRMVARLVDVAKRYGETHVLSSVSLEVHRGDRIGLLGANGSGKSTLLRLIAGVDEPSEGRVTLGVGVEPRYFAQEATAVLDPECPVLDEILGNRPMLPEAVRTYLGGFLFTGDDVYKTVGMLSGGERQRLNLAKLLLDRPNFLLLDEPTNHLDIPSRESLEQALAEFQGTMILATHDRYLLERTATRILTIEDGAIRDFQGTYHEMRRQQTSSAPPPRARRNGPRTQTASASATIPTFDEVAVQIASVERELDDAGRALSDPETYRDAERVKALRAQYDAASARLEELYRQLDATAGE